MAAAKAGLRIAYLQFDGVGEDANAHRKVGNLFDVKLRAIENLHRAGIDIALVVTIVRTINDDQVGPHREVRGRELRQDQLRLVPAGVVHRTRRGHRRSHARRAALHAVAPGRGRQDADRRHRAAARLVSALGGRRGVGRHRSDHRPGRRLGHDEMRLPPELRHGHGAAHQQEDEEMGAAAGRLQRRAVLRRRADDHRRGARTAADEGADGAERAAQLPRARARPRASGSSI